jgi:hypothetical protein
MGCGLVFSIDTNGEQSMYYLFLTGDLQPI